MAGAEFDCAVEEFLRAYAVPRRLREARVAERLSAVEPEVVATSWGDLAAWRLGSGSAVLLVHGWEDDNSLWSPMIDELSERERAVVAFDLPGHGASGGDWGVSFEGTDAIVAVADALGPVDAVIAHSAGCGMTAAALGEGWLIERAAFIAPPLGEGDRWVRYAQRLDVSDAVASSAKDAYFARVGRERESWQPRAAYLALDLPFLVVQSRDDERHSVQHTLEVIPRNPHARLEVVDGPTHRRTARDPDVIRLVADFDSPRCTSADRQFCVRVSMRGRGPLTAPGRGVLPVRVDLDRAERHSTGYGLPGVRRTVGVDDLSVSEEDLVEVLYLRGSDLEAVRQ
jgi:pimeloyl-ACP methyl ester carboxylesterase